MKAAVTERNPQPLGCFVHTLNLVVTDAISASVGAKLEVNTIVQYIKQSSSDLAKLCETQPSLHRDQPKLKQDVPCWVRKHPQPLEECAVSSLPLHCTLLDQAAATTRRRSEPNHAEPGIT